MAGEKETTTTVLSEDDDFDFGTPKASDGEGGKEKETEVADKEKAEDKGKKEEKKEKTPAAEKTEKATEKTTEKAKEKVATGKEKETTEAGKEKETTTEEVENDDIFAPEVKTGDDTKEKFSYKNIAKKADIELDDDSEDEFLFKLSDKIEKSKQEVSLDKFTPDAQKVIKHLNENGGKIDDFFKNTKINSLQGIIGMDPATKVYTVRIQELVKSGMEQEEAQTQAETEVGELTRKELREAAENIDEGANKLIDTEINGIVAEREKFAEKERLKAQTTTALELKQIKNYIDKQDNFIGMKLTPEAKKAILADIESGEFDNIANKNKAVSKFNAYMMGKFGTKIYNKIKTTISEKSREAYNDALDKSTGALHKTKEEAQRGNTGRQKSESSEKKNFDTWGDDLFENK